MIDPHEPPDPDTEARTEALRFIARRTLVWAVPLTLIGALLVGLGLPLWLSVIAMLAVLVTVVFELDL